MDIRNRTQQSIISKTSHGCVNVLIDQLIEICSHPEFNTHKKHSCPNMSLREQAEYHKQAIIKAVNDAAKYGVIHPHDQK
jgi:hypothetical protein